MFKKGFTTEEAVNILKRDFTDHSGRLRNKRVKKENPPGEFYIWRTKGDDKVRSSHAARDGEIFHCKTPHKGIHPGHAPGCRCKAQRLSPEEEKILREIKNGWENKGKEWVEEFMAKLTQISESTADFLVNYNLMIKADTHNADKYFHCKANCQAAKKGAFGYGTSYVLSYGREILGGIEDIIIDGHDSGATKEDSIADEKANDHGRKAGRRNPDIDCKNACKDFRPKALKPKWW